MEFIHYFTKKYYIIEGMDIVGKTTFNKVNLPEHKVYHSDYGLLDLTNNRKNIWILGYNIVNFLETIKPEENIIINRGIFSSYVYERLYNNRYIEKEIIDYYKNNEFFKHEIGHIYIRHQNSETAKTIYEFAQNRDIVFNRINREYDTFKSFNDYWYVYSLANDLFKEIYSLIGITPRVFETLPNMSWIEKNL